MSPISRMLLLLMFGLLCACRSAPDCAQAVVRGQEIGRVGLPPDADRHEVHMACRDEFLDAWHEALEGYCEPVRGFAVGNSDAVYYGVCRDQIFNRNYRLGRTLWVLEVEREALEARLASLEAGHDPAWEGEAVDIRGRLRVLAREIPELETLARIQGLLPPPDPAEIRPD